MALAIDITDGRGLSNEAHHELLLKKEQDKAVNNRLNCCTLLTRRSV